MGRSVAHVNPKHLLLFCTSCPQSCYYWITANLSLSQAISVCLSVCLTDTHTYVGYTPTNVLTQEGTPCAHQVLLSQAPTHTVSLSRLLTIMLVQGQARLWFRHQLPWPDLIQKLHQALLNSEASLALGCTQAFGKREGRTRLR